jgi:hypothetical protein
LRPGSGLGLGFGAFLTSFLPLSLLPMRRSVTQNGVAGKGLKDLEQRSVFDLSTALSDCGTCRCLRQVQPAQLRAHPIGHRSTSDGMSGVACEQDEARCHYGVR